MACERHWWGGCRDNGNVFDTAQECEAECITRVITEPTDDPGEFRTEVKNPMQIDRRS